MKIKKLLPIFLVPILVSCGGHDLYRIYKYESTNYQEYTTNIAKCRTYSPEDDKYYIFDIESPLVTHKTYVIDGVVTKNNENPQKIIYRNYYAISMLSDGTVMDVYYPKNRNFDVTELKWEWFEPSFHTKLSSINKYCVSYFLKDAENNTVFKITFVRDIEIEKEIVEELSDYFLTIL